ncbi:uncharacterized protein LOC128472449 isoform X2 [Spea bombifrons]|uniref:uncharacterized protein LOC128472449 isoform X2 n=1 Tax=Spea bombifrons TaxID=233779 RepID=UPI00234B9FCA|nr:uncharacterized protein LOC128472449 isoform X2 [Spea bombifrons]
MAQSTATKGFLFLVFFQLVIGIQSVELNKCQQFVTDRHIKYLDDMIDNQMESLCTIKVKLLKRKHLSDYCYIRGSVYLLGDLLRKHMLFKINSISFNRTQELTQLYNNGITECMLKNGDSIMRKPKVCSETKDLSLAEILETVRELFKDAKEFREKFSDHHNCAELYKECEEEDEGKEYPPEGPSQCDCPSPSEKPVFQHSPHPSSLVLPTFDTTEEMNLRTLSSYPYKPTAPLGTEPNTDTTSLISTDLSTESVFQHKREYPQDTTILLPSRSKGLPHARTSISPPHDIFLQVTMESPKGPTMPLLGSMQTTGTKTKPINDEKTEHGLWGFFLPLIFIFGLLSSGLLCYRKYRRRSRLNGNQRDPEIPEERALQSNFMEMNDV